MVRGFEQSSPDLLVASCTKLLLARLSEQFGIPSVNLVAVNASEFRLVVLTPMPIRDISPGVTLQANSVLGGSWERFCKIH